MKKSNLFLLLIFIPFITKGQISERIDSLALVHESEGFNGNVLYSKNDSIIFTGNYGFSNFETKKPLDDHTIFDIASNTKQFTALAIVQLIEKGMLTYETKVNEIIKEFPYRDITIEHLLRHQSGLPGYQKILYDRDNWNREEQATNNDLLKILSGLQIDLAFEPGTEYQYSNTGYVVLASIIEQLSGDSYADYVQEHIFKPAGMLSSKVQRNGTYLPDSQNMAMGYTLSPSVLVVLVAFHFKKRQLSES